MTASSLVQEIEALLNGLLQLGRDNPEILLHLAAIARPGLNENQYLMLCSSMLKELPDVFSKLPVDQLPALVAAPPADAVALRLFLELRTVRHLLCTVSSVHLLQLSNNVIPPGPPDYKQRYLFALQQTLGRWLAGGPGSEAGATQASGEHESLARLHTSMSQATLLMERTRLLELDPAVPFELLQVCVELLKMPLSDLVSFARWMAGLTAQPLAILVQLLQLEPAVLFHIRAVFSLMTEAAPLAPAEDDTEMQVLRAAKEEADNDVCQAAAIAAATATAAAAAAAAVATDEATISTSNSSSMHAASSTSPSSTTAADLLSGTFVQAIKSRKRGRGRAAAAATFIDDSDRAAAAAASKKQPAMPRKRGAADVSTADVVQATETTLFPGIRLSVCTQPPTETVYQRILKPPPAVQLEHTGSEEGRASLARLTRDTQRTGLFVEAIVCTEKSTHPQPTALKGTRLIKLQNASVAQFRKLKMMTTSQQQGCDFRLAFQLKRPAGDQGWQVIAGATCYSRCIEVFSHSGYLADRQLAAREAGRAGSAAVAAAAAGGGGPSALASQDFRLREVIPARAPPGSKVVLLGSGFLKSPKLRVRLGLSVMVPPIFHESGTLIVTIPADSTGPLAVSVSNNGIHFCPPVQFVCAPTE